MGIASLFLGASTISPSDVWDALSGVDAASDDALIVRTLRVPRTVTALLVGAALGIAGGLMQAVTRNPLADPGILGVNAGAALAVALGIVATGATNAFGYMWFAFLGAGLAGAAVYLVGGALTAKVSVVRLTLAGVAVSTVLASLTRVLLVNYPGAFDAFRYWDVGTLSGRTLDIAAAVAGPIAVGAGLALVLAVRLNVLALGKDLATSLGSSPRWTFAVAALAVMLLAGGATAAVGPVGFIGLAAAHAARAITGPDYRWLLPYAALLGGIILLAADIIGRVVAAPAEIQTGIMTAVIAGPVFIAVARRRRVMEL